MPGISESYIDSIMENSEFVVSKHGEKSAVVTMITPYGFEMTEAAACVDPDDYDEKIGFMVAKRRLKDRLWEHEGYRAHMTKFCFTPEELPELLSHGSDFTKEEVAALLKAKRDGENS